MNRGISVLLLVVAIVLFVIIGFGAFDIMFSIKDPIKLLGLLGFAGAFFSAAHLPEA